MTNVIGPIDQNVWNTMRLLHSSIAYMRAANDNGKWDKTLEREMKQYKDYKGDIVSAA